MVIYNKWLYKIATDAIIDFCMVIVYKNFKDLRLILYVS